MAQRSLLRAYAMSGACSLVYQVVWYHALVDQLGASATTFLIVLCAFIGGLGVGAVSSRCFYNGLERWIGGRGLENYGRTELAITLSVLCLYGLTRLPFRLFVGSFPYRLMESDGLTFFAPTLGYEALKLVISIVVVSLPCFLMGLTFPYLCSIHPREHRLPSRLYAANTLGACIAVLVTEFGLLPLFGYGLALSLAALVNLAIALRFMRGGPGSEPAPREPSTESATIGTSRYPAVVGGFLCGGWQALCFVIVKLTLGPTRGVFALLSFFAIFAIWIGATAVHRWQPSSRTVALAGVAALAWCGGVWWVEPQVSELLVAVGARIILPAASDYAVSFSISLLVVGAYTLVPYTLWSMLLPQLCDRLQRQGENLSLTYGLNTLSFLAGVLLFGGALQYVHVFFAARVFAVAAAVGLLMLLLQEMGRVRGRGWMFAGVATVGLVGLVVPRHLEMRLLGGLGGSSRRVEAFRSTPQHLFWVRNDSGEGNRTLMFDRHSMSATNLAGQRYMRTMAHLPLLLHPAPRDAMLICLGVGTTAHAMTLHDALVGIDIIDLNKSIFVLNRHFQSEALLKDARIRMITDDGRQFLKLTDRSYDFVTLEPPPPLQPGISRLYSAQFYGDVKRRLRSGGIVSQWLPESQLDQRSVDLITATFVDAFSHTLLFVGYGRELIIVGAETPFKFAGLEQRLSASPRVRDDLARFGVRDSADLLASIMRMSDGMRREWGTKPLIEDGLLSLDTVKIGPVQQVRAANHFQGPKDGLYFDGDEVHAELVRAGAPEAETVSRIQARPGEDSVITGYVPTLYFQQPRAPRE